ncbi:hypothetical protein GCM10010123_20060 [Pilimelia anulata]|uniref:Uncharacterized protein n=1 Tax=Pilimelia anulata TaxID=53371 RepID=A0A8J3B3B5_9ACTN|nr:hypothetical protein [Pilimelia anulata]GGJ90267.1 hypothetical protein GCM10010123_20060 [Pilimelia anulata]
MRLTDLATAYGDVISTAALRTDLTTLAGHDRTQGGQGLLAAAELVAARADRAGLEVHVRHFLPGAADSRWWNYTPSTAPSVRTATLTINGDGAPLIAYPEQPCTVARGCAATPPTGLTGPVVDLERSPDRRISGAFYLLPPTARLALDGRLEQLADQGAVGVAVRTDRRSHIDASLVERLEVADGTRLPVFSVSLQQAARLQHAADAGEYLHVFVECDPPAAMPLVYARRKVRRQGRPHGLLSAHLCHAGPGADDNASGAAALTSIAYAAYSIFGANAGPDLGFLWAPETIGTAAFLHDIADAGDARPDFVVCLDSLGGDPHLCGGTLTIEGSPDHQPSPLAGALEAAARAVQPDARSYAGTVRLPTWARGVVPFVGAGDHALYADPAIGIPAARLCRQPNRYQHTSGDTPATICYPELRRGAITAAAAVTALCIGGPALTEVTDAATDLALRRITALLGDTGLRQLTTADLVAAVDAAHGGLDVLSRWHPSGLLDVEARRKEVAEHAHRLAPVLPPPVTSLPVGRVPLRGWTGPWTLHALAEALNTAGRRRLAGLLGDGPADYARLVALAHAVDDASPVPVLAARAATATGLPVDAGHAEALFDVIAEAGWLTWSSA